MAYGSRSVSKLRRASTALATAGLFVGVLGLTAIMPGSAATAGAATAGAATVALPTMSTAGLSQLAKIGDAATANGAQPSGLHAAPGTGPATAPQPHFLAAAPAIAIAAPVLTVDTTVDAHEAGAAPPGTCSAAAPAVEGTCSLRAAIETANLAGTAFTINVPSGVYPLSLGQLVITDPAGVSITGGFQQSTIIDGSGQADRVLQLSGSGAQAQLSNLTLTGGTAPTGTGAVDPGWGGGISVYATDASLVLNGVSVQGNSASMGGGGIDNFGRLWATGAAMSSNVVTDTNDTWSGGGGLDNEHTGSANLTNTFFFDNSIDGTGGGNGSMASGGGIYTTGTLAVNGAFIQSNIVHVPNSTSTPNQGEGGGITTDGPTTLANVTVADNAVDPDPGATNTEAFGGGISDNSGLSTLATSTIQNNLAAGDSSTIGGGLEIFTGLVNITGTQVTGNSATVTSGSFSGGSGGGGIALAGSVAIASSVISGNTATATTTMSTTTGQTVQGTGGGLFAVAGTVTIDGTAITNNTAGVSGAATSSGYGGGVSATSSAVGGLIIRNSPVTGNTVINGFGGGVFSNNALATTLEGDTFSANSAFGNAGTLSTTGGAGGGVFGFGTASISNTTFDSNHSDVWGGGLVEATGGLLTGDTVSNNTATIGAGLYVEPLTGGTPTQIVNSTFAGNEAQEGGGIGLAGGTSIDLNYSTVTGNSAPTGGGLIVDPTNGAVVDATGSIVSGNTVGDCAGSASPVSTHGYNLLGTGCTTTPAPTDLIGVDPMLAPLAGNGGPTQTVALFPGSPAINAGGGPSCPTTDQRGVSRPQGKACDIGAFESTFNGYWEVASDGGIFTFGDATFFGSMGGQTLDAPVVGMASTPDGQGYWEVAADGGVFTFGDAPFFDSEGGQHLNKPIVGIASTPDGHGYWLVGADGAVFPFGDAQSFGDASGLTLKKRIVGMASTPDGKGYWLTAANGVVFPYGDAGRYGDTAGQTLAGPVRAIAGTPSGHGYTLAAADGGVFNFGDAGFFGSMGGRPLNAPVTGLATTNDGQGYWLFATDGGVFSFGDARFSGSMGGQPLNEPVVGGTTPG